MSKIEIQNPLSRSMFKVFLTQYIQIYFFKKEKDHKESFENLKNLLFPPETTDEVFNNLITFVTKLIDKMIKTEKELEEVFGEINEEYSFDENTFNDIITTVEAQKEEIISKLNKICSIILLIKSMSFIYIKLIFTFSIVLRDLLYIFNLII